MAKQKLKVFLCYASNDKRFVNDLNQLLSGENWIDTWQDTENLLPGQDWRIVIEKAVEASDIILLCLSNNSINKEGFIQKELRYAREISLEKPEGSIFLIPLRFDDCDIPRGLKFLQWIDFFGNDKNKNYEKLRQSLQTKYNESIQKDDEKGLKSETKLLFADTQGPIISNLKILIKDTATTIRPTSFSLYIDNSYVYSFEKHIEYYVNAGKHSLYVKVSYWYYGREMGSRGPVKRYHSYVSSNIVEKEFSESQCFTCLCEFSFSWYSVLTNWRKVKLIELYNP